MNTCRIQLSVNIFPIYLQKHRFSKFKNDWYIQQQDNNPKHDHRIGQTTMLQQLFQENGKNSN